MLANDSFHVAVLPGDGIGPEVMAPAWPCWKRREPRRPAETSLNEAPAGAGLYRDTGVTLPGVHW